MQIESEASDDSKITTATAKSPHKHFVLIVITADNDRTIGKKALEHLADRSAISAEGLHELTQVERL